MMRQNWAESVSALASGGFGTFETFLVESMQFLLSFLSFHWKDLCKVGFCLDQNWELSIKAGLFDPLHACQRVDISDPFFQLWSLILDLSSLFLLQTWKPFLLMKFCSQTQDTLAAWMLHTGEALPCCVSVVNFIDIYKINPWRCQVSLWTM